MGHYSLFGAGLYLLWFYFAAGGTTAYVFGTGRTSHCPESCFRCDFKYDLLEGNVGGHGIYRSRFDFAGHSVAFFCKEKGRIKFAFLFFACKKIRLALFGVRRSLYQLFHLRKYFADAVVDDQIGFTVVGGAVAIDEHQFITVIIIDQTGSRVHYQ